MTRMPLPKPIPSALSEAPDDSTGKKNPKLRYVIGPSTGIRKVLLRSSLFKWIENYFNRVLTANRGESESTTFSGHLQTEPDRLAIVEIGGKSIPRQILERRVYALANHLRNQGMKKGDRVLVQIPPGVELTVTILAVLWVGGVVVLLESGVGDDIYTTRVTQIAPKWILIHSKLVWIHRLPGVRSLLAQFDITVRLGNIEHSTSLTLSTSLFNEGEPIAPAEMSDEDESIVVFTGGTTSAPSVFNSVAVHLDIF